MPHNDTPPGAIAARVAELLDPGTLTRLKSFTGREADPTEFIAIVSERRIFGSTAGPFGGVGGAAMTWFTLTCIASKDTMILFAGRSSDRLFGVAPFDAAGFFAMDPSGFDQVPRVLISTC